MHSLKTTFAANVVSLFGLGSSAAPSLPSSVAVPRMFLTDISEACLSVGKCMLVVPVGLVLARGRAKDVISSSSLAIAFC